ncbi:hypothetical protein E9993_04130 [Labilibacter sediminis]|nr:hypothetical protein E9993_04130 [Labilibacter sediminis]
MRFLLLISIVVSLFTFNCWGQSGWTNQTPSSTYAGLLGVYAVDAEHVWAVGQSGTVLHSSNGGSSWNVVNTGYTDDFLTVTFLNRDTGFVAGDPESGGAFVLKTVDRGVNWTRIDLPQSVATHVNEIDFSYSESEKVYTIYATGGLGHVWKSQIPGDSWTQLGGGCGNGNFNACWLVDENTGWFVGTPDAQYNFTIMNTIDGGVSFEEQTNPTERKLNGVSFANSVKGVAVGLVATILYTENGGATWENRANSGYRWQAVDMITTGKAWAVGNGGNIVYSADYGYTWTDQDCDQSCELWDVHFISDTEGWIVGGGIGYPGVVLHTSTGGVATSINPDSEMKLFSMDQNYPNPVYFNTEINYQIQMPGVVSISLYNSAGIKLESLVNEYQLPGNYTIKFENHYYPNGIYYYEMRVGQVIVQTRKMILIK